MTGQNMGIVKLLILLNKQFFLFYNENLQIFSVIFFTIQKLAISLHREKRGLCEGLLYLGN